MQQQQPTSTGTAHQGVIPNPEGIWCYRCTTCRDVFTSSQGLAGHQGKHKSEGTWIRGAPHEKFFCPSAEIPDLYRQLGTRKSTPTVLRGEGNFYRLRNPVVYKPRRLPERPWAVLHQPQQAMVLQVPHVVTSERITSLSIQDQNLFANHPNQLVENTNVDDQEEIDLELRL
uniref:C2H2-type domain-containing protein n=1 Tax=Solanum lycopersicum TaxID=4081 RepID=A0A3Q7F303_SOLLC